MSLKFKKPSLDTQIAMSKVASGEDNNEYYSLAETKLADLNNHQYAKLVNSGNAAIFVAMNSICGNILVPDQGAWNGFKQIAKFLNKKLITVKTNQGLFDLDYLKECLDSELFNSNNCGDYGGSLDSESSAKDNNFKSALFLTSFAAYTAEQDIKKISKFAHKNNLLIVEDASGAVSDSKGLSDGNYSDIIIGSTGSPKIVNVGSGGFITTNDSAVFEKSRLLLKTFKTSNIVACGINKELDFAHDTLNKSVNSSMYLKESIEDKTNFNVFHKNKRGINVILETDNSKSLSYKLRQELVLDSHGMVTKCPNYNRIKENAVCLEIKNLDVSCLREDNLDRIIDVIKQFD